MRAASVVEVSEAAVWAELAARAPIEAHLAEALSPTRRVALPSFEAEIQPLLGLLVRLPRRPPAEVAAANAARAEAVARLPEAAREVLYAAQRHAEAGRVRLGHAWDPVADADAVRALLGAALLRADDDDRFALDPDLPTPPPLAFDAEEALMDETDDLSAPDFGPIALLHDLAALAAAVEHVRPARALTGALLKPDAKRIAARLAVPDLDAPRWARAWRALEALGVVSSDPFTRAITLDLGLERTLAGETGEAVHALLLRLIEPDLHGALELVRATLAQAGGGAVDELVWTELVRDQHRNLIFPAWRREGRAFYPFIAGEPPRLLNDEGFEAIEAPMLGRLLARLTKLGVLRRAAGVFAATADGRVWAGAPQPPAPPVWVTGDLEVLIPPGALTPWERFQVERLGRCLARDVADRLRLERASLEAWLATHEVDEAIEVLARRAPGLPPSVPETLHGWATSATRAVLWRGVLLG